MLTGFIKNVEHTLVLATPDYFRGTCLLFFKIRYNIFCCAFSIISKGGEFYMLVLAIETKRYQMIGLAKKYGYTSELTVKCSQELDKLLNIAQHSFFRM